MTIKMSKLFTAVLLLTLASCSGGGEHGHGMDTTSPTGKGININPNELATNMDLVCQMDMSKIRIADTAHYNGGIYAFCSESCKKNFQKQPEKFVAQ